MVGLKYFIHINPQYFAVNWKLLLTINTLSLIVKSFSVN